MVLTPVALAGLVVTAALVAWFHREEFSGGARLEMPPGKAQGRHVNRVLVARALLATAMMVGLFFARPAARQSGDRDRSACYCSPGGSKANGSTREIDWSLLLMFAGLFIIVAGAQRALLTPDVVRRNGAAAPGPGSRC